MNKRILSSLLLLTALICQIKTPAETTKTKLRLVDYYGRVKDGFTGADLPAFITLMKEDSTVVDTMTAIFASENNDAGYYFRDKPVEKGKYIVKASLEGYDNAYIEKDIRYVGRNTAFEFPIIKMHRRMDSYTHELNEVKATGTLVKLVHKGDTLVYNAQAFKVPNGSMLDGLIRQLPGAKLESNGDILVNGRKIENLTLNGDDFFKGNNSVMLNNLPYFTVNQVKVYNKQTDRSRKAGADVEERVFTMDIILKREYNRGYIANMQLGGGTRGRYTGQTFLLGYDDLSHISVYGNMNDINQNPNPGDQGDWEPEDMGDGVNTSKKAGLDFQTKDKEENWKDHFTSEVSWQKNKVQTEEFDQQFADPENVFSNQNDDDRQHHFNWMANNKLEIGKSVTWNLGTSYQNQRVNEQIMDSTYTLDDRVNQSLTSIHNRNHTYKISSDLQYFGALPWGDDLELTFHGGYGTEHYSEEKGTDLHYFRTRTHDSQLLTGNNPRHNYNFGGSTGYQILLRNGLSVMPSFAYEQSYQYINSTYLRNDTLEENSYLSGLLTKSEKTAIDVVFHRYGKSTTIFTSNIAIKHQYEKFNLSTLDGNSAPIRHSWLPSTNTTFAVQNERNTLMATYLLLVSSLQMRMIYGPDNTLDPLITIYKNPYLRNTVTNHLEAFYTHNFSWHGLNLGTQIKWNAIHGKVGYQKDVDMNTGHYAFRPGNINGNWDTSVGFTEDLKLDHSGLFYLSEATEYNYIHNVDFDISTNGLSTNLSKVNNSAIQQNMKITYKKNDFQLGLKSSLIAAHVTGNRNDFENFSYYNYDYGMNLQTPLFWKLNFVTDFSIYSRRGYSIGTMNSDDLVWNSSISHSFANNKLVISLEAYDLLHQLSKNRLTINSQARTEIHVNTIPNYFMLRVQYHFNILPKKK